MTTFAALETSADSSRPVEIYRFVIGTREFTYTNNASTLTIDLDDYLAIPITRPAVVAGAEERKREFPIRVPVDASIVSEFVGSVPGVTARVFIHRLQRDEIPVFNTRALQFKGRVESVKFPDDVNAEIVCRSVEAGVGKAIPRYTYQAACGHVLYGAGCDVNPAPFTFVGVCTSRLANVITVAGAGAFAGDQFFRAGVAKPTALSDHRLVLSQIGDNILLSAPFAADPVGSEIQLIAGCDHSFFGHCGGRFSNKPKNGGHPWVPNKNIFATGLS